MESTTGAAHLYTRVQFTRVQSYVLNFCRNLTKANRGRQSRASAAEVTSKSGLLKKQRLVEKRTGNCLPPLEKNNGDIPYMNLPMQRVVSKNWLFTVHHMLIQHQIGPL